ncbi:acetolactate synthase small subunit [Thiomicrorhabdus immobilis]|uniref:Acetolactate synthase small subunit n=1 Tax=Thiomicrorhabdus immobilis TaxID=2791037 RepID=A0ABN6D1F6_9GAMM|nr:acetolactate synthase small subunit [Thiomicrorhabdus immobilis]BCN93799.1 acetolactate synthase small subunit [Thiomicrorhabdus immobilis]
MKHIISMLMENESGALSRVAGLFSARGYNIHALTVAPTEDDSLSRLTLVTSGTSAQIEQVVKHLNRLIDVVKVLDLTEGSHIERELMLIKLSATGDMREEYKRLADIFRGDIIDVTATTYTVQMVGESKKLDAFIDAIDPVLILETVRSGTVGVMRGEKCLHV